MRSSSYFISGAQVWEEITKLVRSAKRVHAAVAYVGEAGTRLLPLRKGDHLVVDLSLRNVRAGVTNPFVIERYIRKGVMVASRPGLHAKVIVADRTAVVGSANVSALSAGVLEEAAVVTRASGVVRGALGFIASAAIEPVRPEYLKRCKEQYRPPRGGAPKVRGGDLRPRLWVINLNGSLELPEVEQSQYEASSRKAARRRRGSAERTELDDFWWYHRPTFAKHVQLGDWMILSVHHRDGSVKVWPPAQFLWLDRYPRGRGKDRYITHLERPRGGMTVSWTRFSKAVPQAFQAKYLKPRTRGIVDPAEADALLSLWTLSGRFRAVKR